MRIVLALSMVLAVSVSCSDEVDPSEDTGATAPEDGSVGSDAGSGTDSGISGDASSGRDAGAPADTGASNPDTGPADTGMTPNNEPAGLMGITAAHNRVRDTVGVPHLVWDPALAAIAQAWAETCTDNSAPSGLLDHNPGRSNNYPGYVGENIYASSGQARPQDAVSAWASELADYDYDTNSCSGICGHYTQVVWRTSERLGCGLSDCPNLRYRSTIVCNYSPGGNTGGRPY